MIVNKLSTLDHAISTAVVKKELVNLDKVQECLTMFQCQGLITAKTSKKTLFRSCGTIECLRCNCHLLLQPNKF